MMMKPLSREELVSWINASLPLGVPSITRLESLRNGAVLCMLVNALFPSHVSIENVRSDAADERDVLENYNILYEALASMPGPTSLISDLDIPALSEGRVGEIARFVQRLEFLARVQKRPNKRPMGRARPCEQPATATSASPCETDTTRCPESAANSGNTTRCPESTANSSNTTRFEESTANSRNTTRCPEITANRRNTTRCEESTANSSSTTRCQESTANSGNTTRCSESTANSSNTTLCQQNSHHYSAHVSREHATTTTTTTPASTQSFAGETAAPYVARKEDAVDAETVARELLESHRRLKKLKKDEANTALSSVVAEVEDLRRQIEAEIMMEI